MQEPSTGSEPSHPPKPSQSGLPIGPHTLHKSLKSSLPEIEMWATNNNLVKHLHRVPRGHGGPHQPISPVDIPIAAEIESPPSPPDIAPQGTTYPPMRRYPLPATRQKRPSPPRVCATWLGPTSSRVEFPRVRFPRRSHPMHRVPYRRSPSSSRSVPGAPSAAV